MTILTETAHYRGRDIPICEMRPNSAKKIEVRCPSCGTIRETWLKVITRRGNHKCHQCTLKERKQTLEIGAQFAKWTVLSPAKRTGKSICRCECGKIAEVDNYALKNGGTCSCGCLKKHNFDNVVRLSGAQHGRWKGGVTSANHKIRQSTEYKYWRSRVFERDKFQCQKCGQVGGRLRAHHIQPFAEAKHLRMDVDNGITLCYGCHKLFHTTYGRANNNQSQIEQFLK